MSEIKAERLPEVPNLLVLLSHFFYDSEFFTFLEHWSSIFFAIIAAIALAFFFHFSIRKRELIPRKTQNFIESIVVAIRAGVIDILGPKGEQFVPFIASLFVYIVIMNWLVLIPFFKAPSSSLNVTLGLSLTVFFYIQYLNIKNYGFFGFIHHMAGSPKNALEWLLAPLMFPIELLTQLARPLTLSLRLFGNIFGEDILIGIFSLFGVAALAAFNAPIGLPFQTPFLFLAIFTGLLQGLVFCYLTTIYILLSFPNEEEH
jgi:F-type H+-transporting ATPase subunit a